MDAHCAVLGEALIGVYLHGSRAGAGPVSPGSDFDLLTVLRDSPSEQIEQEILQIHRSAGLLLDSVYATSEQINSNVVPTPILFVVKPFGGVQLLHLPGGSRDLPLLRQDVFSNGKRLYGSEIRKVVRPVGMALLVKSLRIILPHIAERFRYPMLQFCRVLHTCATGQAGTKVQAAQWALRYLDPRWRPSIQLDLQRYISGAGQMAQPKEILHEMAARCERELATLEGNPVAPPMS